MAGPILDYATSDPLPRWSPLAIVAALLACVGFFCLLILARGFTTLGGLLGATAFSLGTIARYHIAISRGRLKGGPFASAAILFGGLEATLLAIEFILNGMRHAP